MRDASLIGGAGAMSLIGGRIVYGDDPQAKMSESGRNGRLPREVWVATISQEKMEADSVRQMTGALLRRMEETLVFQPDVICIPEVAPFVNLTAGRPPVSEVAEVPIGEISAPFAEFAKKNNCNVVCPIYTKEGGRCFNSAVFIDRQGQTLGEYRKMHPTIDEMQAGVSPGPPEPPVIATDFGKVGAQICFDMQWNDGWMALERGGAEIVFWPSAFAGGAMVNTRAWQHKYAVVSSTRKGTTKICDIDGTELAKTSHWDRWCCTPINLEKVFLHTWPYVQRFSEIKAKYGRKVRIVNHAEEEWTVIESRSPEVRLADIVKEFDLLTHREHIDAADRVQKGI